MTKRIQKTQNQEITNFDIGQKIRLAREEAGISQAELARLVGLDRRTICSYEKGRVRIPTVTFLEIVRLLNRSVDEIMGIGQNVDGRTIEGKLKHKFLQLQKLSDEKQKAIIQFIEAFLADSTAANVTK